MKPWKSHQTFLPPLLTFGCAVLVCLGADPTRRSVVPKDGFVPNELTAARIAEAILIPIYGEEQVRRQKPLSAKLTNNVWTVTGTLPKGMLGGVAEVDLSKQDGCILRVSHGR